MIFQLDLQLLALKCLQPDESEEEPYLWTFYFQLDGDTVRQPKPNVFELVGNVKIAAGAGGHGNLSSSTATAGQALRIPANVGGHRAQLRPIRLQILGQTIVVPGRLLAFCVLMEEDATSDESILKAHAALRDFLELRWNDFISNQLNQGAVTSEMSNVQASGGLTGRALILASVQSLIDRFVDGLEAPAQAVVRDAVIGDSDIFGLIDNFFDADDSMGTQRMSFDERQIIDAGFEVPIHTSIIRTEDGKWTAFHDLSGNLHGTLHAGGNDLVQVTGHVETKPIDSGEGVLEGALICIPPGTRVAWTRNGTKWAEEIRFTYPFLGVRWSVEGVVIDGASGTVSFPADCSFPTFDSSRRPSFSRSEMVAGRQVTVRYQIEDRGDEGKVLTLFNDPADGNFNFTITAVGVAGKGIEIPIGRKMVGFAGQRIDSDFEAKYRECIDELDRRGSKSRRVDERDLWDPHTRLKIQDEMFHVVDDLAVVRRLDAASTARVKEGIASKLHVTSAPNRDR